MPPTDLHRASLVNAINTVKSASTSDEFKAMNVDTNSLSYDLKIHNPSAASEGALTTLPVSM
jgi:shikimate 5-dehydrogenase